MHSFIHKVRLIVYIPCLFFCLGLAHGSPSRIWIDTDIAVGSLGNDVDDGIALIMALRSPEVEIKGISLVSNIHYGYRICHKLLAWYANSNKGIPIYKGARRAKELGTTNSAVEALACALAKERLTIIALGPVTNIANLLLLHPELKERIIQIIWCAGRRPYQHFDPGSGKINVCDCNFDHAPEGGEILLNSGVKIVLSGYEPASCIYISTHDILPLKISPFKRDRWIYHRLNNWLKIWTFFLGTKRGFIPFDAVTLGCILSPELAEICRNIPAKVESGRNDNTLRLFKSNKPYLIASPFLDSAYKVDYCITMDSKFKDIILELLVPRESF